MSKRIIRWTKIISITIVATLCAFSLYEPFAPNPQKERREKAKAYLPVVDDVITKDTRFADVRAEIDYDGAILVTGKIRSEDEYLDLKKTVTAKSLPLTILFTIDPSGEPERAR